MNLLFTLAAYFKSLATVLPLLSMLLTNPKLLLLSKEPSLNAGHIPVTPIRWSSERLEPLPILLMLLFEEMVNYGIVTTRARIATFYVPCSRSVGPRMDKVRQMSRLSAYIAAFSGATSSPACRFGSTLSPIATSQ